MIERIMRENDMLEKEEIFSKVLRAGRRTQTITILQLLKARSSLKRMVLFTLKNTKFIYIKKILVLLPKFWKK